MLEIVKYPDPILRRRAEPLKEINDAVVARVQAMLETMYAVNGVGLAAPQVGWPVRLFTLNLTRQPEDALVFVNPVLQRADGEQEEEEGCLSFPGLFGKVRRSARVTVAAYDLKGEEFAVEGEELLARALQQELDHLDGVLFITRMTEASRAAAKTRLKELEQESQRDSQPPSEGARERRSHDADAAGA